MKRNKITTLLLVLGLVSLTLGVSIAFFNYTRTGSPNTIGTGRIAFNTTQDGNISLTNIFPMDSEDIDNLLETGNNVTINITGDTSYQYGVEYLVTAEEVNITVNDKKIPLNLYISSTTDLGDDDEDYFDNRGGDESIYKVLSGGVVHEGQYLLVGYIAPGQTGIDGSLNIKAYIDKDKIAISDTYDGTESDNMGTTTNWVAGRTVFTTEEWNSIQGTGHELSFKIRVEANEGIWVDPYTTPNLMNNINFNRNGANVTEIRFIEETPLRMQRRYDASPGSESNGTKLEQTYQDTGKVLAWIEEKQITPSQSNSLIDVKPSLLINDYNYENSIEQIDNEPEYILYIASSGKTQWVIGDALFNGFTNVERIIFENVDSSHVTGMNVLFNGLSKLSYVNINALDTSNVTGMYQMFGGCSSLTSIDLSGMGGNNLSTISGMFSGCTNLATINMSNFNFGATTTLYQGSGLFQNLTNLTSVNLSGSVMNNVAVMSSLFEGDTSLTSVDLSGLGSDNLGNVGNMFYNCTSLKNINMSNFNFGRINSFNDADSSGIFYPVKSVLETINLSGANFSGVNISSSSFENMFYSFSKLTSVNLSNANLSKVNRMASMFEGCSLLANINFENVSTTSVIKMQRMFVNCTSLISINLSNLGSDNLNQVNYMFVGCSNLKEINMSNFNFGSSNLHGNDSPFFHMTNIENINFNNANISNVTNMGGMFSGCTNLATIYVGNGWDVSGVTDSIDMFFGCTSLVGGAGTHFDNTAPTDKTRAHVDGGQSNPGYLTLAS